jgi:hypothetical protein
MTLTESACELDTTLAARRRAAHRLEGNEPFGKALLPG